MVVVYACISQPVFVKKVLAFVEARTFQKTKWGE